MNKSNRSAVKALQERDALKLKYGWVSDKLVNKFSRKTKWAKR